MAGNCIFQLWWWIPLAILSGCFLCPNGNRTSFTHLGYLPSNIDADAVADADTDANADVVVFLREDCDRDIDVNRIREFVENSDFDVSIGVMPKSVTCETQSWGLGSLIHVLGQAKTKALIAALDSPTCEIATRLAHLWRTPLLTWTCPLRVFEERELSSVIRLSPSLLSLSYALAKIFLHFGWKSVAVISTDHEPWSSLGGAIVDALRGINVVLRYHLVLPRRASVERIRKILKSVHGIPRRATVLCLPFTDESTNRVLIELDVMWRVHSTKSIVLMMHTKEDDLFLPPDLEFEIGDATDEEIATFSSLDSLEDVSTTTDSLSPSNVSFLNASRFPSNQTSSRNVEEEDGKFTEGKPLRRFVPSSSLSNVVMENLLVVVPFDQRYDVLKVYNGTEVYVPPTLLDRLNESLNVLTRDNSSINSHNNKMYTYAVMDWRVDKWRPIIAVTEREERLTIQRLAKEATVFVEVVESNEFLSCEDTANSHCSADPTELSFRGTHVIAIAIGSLLLVLLVVLVTIIIRKHLLKKRMSKGPYKIILTTSDFVFPQVPQVDSRTVDEGIEAMLCCWLQQLQEFGGPEVEKPDLLQLGSVGSLKPYLRTSTGNLSRHAFLKDPRARYNGDLVQLKELPCQGAFELKSKAMDVLVMIHGLRHENLNPFIGCLNEPTRPCLVSEYCSRGSLEDVLVQDEIKLDWSFRLSLLTDVVRGMRYLHGSPIRVHGYLTSRNCVIDARWGVKITDYGLPAFYEAQNIVPPTKTARDLLWTAPELLRLPNLRKKGTQPGDVYSFGIIMQEVVVRGEPFCMLALSPEDIIEKVMKPPPLIRPSVSKGAAPPEAINIMRQCWAENADMRPNFENVYDLFKKLNHGRKVNFVDTMFQMLEKYSNNLEELIRERTEQLDMEKKKTEQLLNRMLPSSVAEKLKLGMPVDPEEFREVTIYFSDIVGFTTISAHSTPFQVVDLLNDLYTCFDATINAYNVYKVETIGDAYMVVGGCPVRVQDHASQIATMALDLLHQSGKFKLRHLPKMQLRLRIGLHTGPCCAGVVGLTMPRYCLFGDTVNTASRMESTGAPWRIHLSQATKDRLTRDGGYHIEYRGSTDVKGKGKMPTYWLLGKEGFDKELPTPPPLGENHGLDENVIMENLPNEKETNSRDFEETLTKTRKRGATEVGSSNAVIVDEVSLGISDDTVSEEVIDGSKRNDTPRSFKKDNVPVVFSNSEDRTQTENAEAKKICVSVHEEGALLPNHSFDSATELVETQSTRNGLTKNSVGDGSDGGGGGAAAGGGDGDGGRGGGGGDGGCGESNPPSTSVAVSKSTSGDTQISLGVSSISGAEIAPVFLGASTTSLTSISSSATFSHRVPSSRHRRITSCINENDLSTPYNHYRCLSPNEHYGRNSVCRLLKRQFSLDRPDEPTCSIALTPEQTNQRTAPRLYKQNSAGAANDLERIEEVPSTPGPLLQNYRHPASVSLSVESLSLH